MFFLKIVHLLMRKTHFGAHGYNLSQKVVLFTQIALAVSKLIRSLIELVFLTPLLHQIGLLHAFKCLDL